MTAVAPIVHWLIDALTRQGIRATADLSDLNPPSAYVAVDRITVPTALCGDGIAHLNVFLAVPATSESTAYTALDEMVTTFISMLDYLDIPLNGDLEAVTIAPSVPGEPMPALRAPISIDLE